MMAGGCRWEQEGYHHLCTLPPTEVLPQDPAAFGARVGKEVQVGKIMVLCVVYSILDDYGVVVHAGCDVPCDLTAAFCRSLKHDW